jgi:hypothetical protein
MVKLHPLNVFSYKNAVYKNVSTTLSEDIHSYLYRKAGKVTSVYSARQHSEHLLACASGNTRARERE